MPEPDSRRRQGRKQRLNNGIHTWNANTCEMVITVAQAQPIRIALQMRGYKSSLPTILGVASLPSISVTLAWGLSDNHPDRTVKSRSCGSWTSGRPIRMKELRSSSNLLKLTT